MCPNCCLASKELRLLACYCARIFCVSFAFVIAPSCAVWSQSRSGDSAKSLANNFAGQNHSLAQSGSTPVTIVTIDPNVMVLRSVQQAVWGPPVSCKVLLNAKAYGQQSVLSGEYKSAGLGSGEFRYTLRLSVGETTQDFLQVSDGRMMYTQVGLDQPPRRVILDPFQQIRNSSGVLIESRPEINLYLAIGGQAELLRGLYNRYFWYKAVGGKLNGLDVWQLVGRVRTKLPDVIAHTTLDDANLKLEGLPETLPQEVRLTLSQSASLAYFPYKVEYFQKRRQGSSPSIERVCEISFIEPSTQVTFTEADFQYRISDSIEKIEDETSMYLPSVPVQGVSHSAPRP